MQITNNKLMNPILITGAHRSGTTWVGHIISKAPKTRYIHEPFNVGKENPQRPFKRWFEHVSDTSDQQTQDKTLAYIKSFYEPSLEHLFYKLKAAKRLKSCFKEITDFPLRLNHRPLIKDPIALMSAPWLYQHLKCDVVITVRHPAAFVDSIITHNWPFPFDHFFTQEQLMETHLANYQTDIATFAKYKKPLIEQAILLWNIIYSVVLEYKQDYNSHWYFVKHEDLSLNPVLEFKKLFSFLNLEFTKSVSNAITDTTTSERESKLSRDSRKNIKKWQNKLTNQDIQLIKKGTRPLWENYYDKSDW